MHRHDVQPAKPLALWTGFHSDWLSGGRTNESSLDFGVPHRERRVMVCLTRARLHTTRRGWQRTVGQGGGVSAETPARPRLALSRTSSVTSSIGSILEEGNIDFARSCRMRESHHFFRPALSCFPATTCGRKSHAVRQHSNTRKFSGNCTSAIARRATVMHSINTCECQLKKVSCVGGRRADVRREVRRCRAMAAPRNGGDRFSWPGSYRQSCRLLHPKKGCSCDRTTSIARHLPGSRRHLHRSSGCRRLHLRDRRG
jgi:hypothetical protein